MKKLLTTLVLAIIAMTFSGLEADGQKMIPAGVSATVTNAYLEHNRMEQGQKVMFVRYGARIFGLRGGQVKCVVSLYKKNGKPLTDLSGKALSNTLYLNPAYDDTVYNNNWAWFAYSHMKVTAARTDCYALIKIYNARTGKLIGKSQKLDFWVNK